ncbi:hypothetical protein D3C71_1285300 [compost metagenome]
MTLRPPRLEPLLQQWLEHLNLHLMHQLHLQTIRQRNRHNRDHNLHVDLGAYHQVPLTSDRTLYPSDRKIHKRCLPEPELKTAGSLIEELSYCKEIHEKSLHYQVVHLLHEYSPIEVDSQPF